MLATSLVLVLASRSASADCVIFGMRPTVALPTMESGQEFSFLASDDCETLRLSIRGTGLSWRPKSGGPDASGPTTYRVVLTDEEWDEVVALSGPTLTWVVTGTTSDGVVTRVSTTNEIQHPTRDLATADATLLGEDRVGAIGWIVADAGDVNGDGQADVLIPAPSAGAVYLSTGPVTGTIDLSEADTWFLGPSESAPGWGWGWSAASAGDVDADGYDDVIIGDVFYGPRGRPYQGAAYLVLGPVTGSFDLSLADAIFVGATATDQAGFSVSSAGDMDGDGLPDVLVGAPNAATSEGAFCCAGAAYVMSGTRRGSHGLGTAGGPMDTWYFGTSVDGLGDVDGDGLDDVLITANDDLDGDDDVSYAGASYVLFGPVSGRLDPSDADAKLVGEADYDYAGIGNSGNATAAAGDVDADGLRDIVIGTYSESDTGAAYVVHGGVTGTLSLADADAKLVGEAEGDNAGVSVSGAGDVDADGHDDILVGAWLNSEGGTNAGAAYLVRGPVTGSLDLGRADLKLVGAEEDQAGAAVSSAGDIDGDGRADVLVGAPGHSVDGVNGGAAYVLYGSGL